MNSERLADVCTLIVDCPHKTAPTSAEPYAYAVGTKAIDASGRIDFEQTRPVDASTYTVWTARAVPAPGDLIFCREAPVGPVAIVPESPPVCLGQRTMLLRPNPGIVDHRWLAYKLRDRDTLNRLLGLSEGSTVAHLNVAEVKRLEIDLPSLDDQQVVARVLGALDNKIDSNRRLAALLEETAGALFKARFLDFVGVDEFEESEIGPIPRGWRAGVLGELVVINMGQSPPGASYSDDATVGPLMVQGMGGFGLRFPEATVYTSAPTKMAAAGATLMTVRAPVGAVNIAREATCLGRGVAGVTSDTPAFAEFLVRSLANRWASEESGTIFPAVNRKQIMGLPLAVPTADAIGHYERVAAPIVEHLAGLSDETASVTSVRDELLPKLISGEIRVPASSTDAIELAEELVA